MLLEIFNDDLSYGVLLSIFHTSEFLQSASLNRTSRVRLALNFYAPSI